VLVQALLRQQLRQELLDECAKAAEQSSMKMQAHHIWGERGKVLIVIQYYQQSSLFFFFCQLSRISSLFCQ